MYVTDLSDFEDSCRISSMDAFIMECGNGTDITTSRPGTISIKILMVYPSLPTIPILTVYHGVMI